MEMTVADVARQYGRSRRFVQQAVSSGQLTAHRRLSRQMTIDDISARAWSRSLGRGRRWAPETIEAAMDLLERGETHRLSSSERSRLARRLRTMSAREIAHAAGGTGPWARYRSARSVSAERIGPSATASLDLGLVGGNDWMTFIRTDDLDSFELEHDVVLDPDGDVGVVQRPRDDRRIRVLIDTYLLGDARQSSAAGTALEERARR